MTIHLLVLNYNGRELLAECLPSVLRAAERSQHECRVAVVENNSTDGSHRLLVERFPGVRVIDSENLGLCSFNRVLEGLDGSVAVLLNNDIKLHEDSIDPLVEPLLACQQSPTGDRGRCFMTAPKCWLFDGTTYEGLKTSIRWRFGLVQATALFDGHEAGIDWPDATASAGAVLAVDRCIFLELGGFDSLYLPGRLEDLDFAFRGYRAGYHARYVPRAVAYHRGMATFGKEYGQAGCDRLALRNTLLFQWKNLRHPWHIARQLAGLSVRAVWDVCRAGWMPRERRFEFLRTAYEAWKRWRSSSISSPGEGGRETVTTGFADMGMERDFFRRFHPRQLRRSVRWSASLIANR